MGVVVIALAMGASVAASTPGQHGWRVSGVERSVVAAGGLAAVPASLQPPSTKGNIRHELPPPVIPRAGALFDLLFRNPDVLIGVRQNRSREVQGELQRAAAVRLSSRVGIWSVGSLKAARLIAELDRRGLLTFVEPNFKLKTFRYSDPFAQPAYSWHLYAVGADLETPPGPGFPLTIIDSEFDQSHLDFAGRPDTTVTHIGTPEGGGEQHETLVASTAAAATNGVGGEGLYPRARLRIFDLGSLTIANIISAIDASIRAGPSVINMSFGGPDVSYAFYQEIMAAFGTGSLLVAAAGNEFQEGNPVEYPASYPHVLTAAATDQQSQSASFSSANSAVDLGAPGVDIPVAVDRTRFVSVDGTSFSSPMVAAAASWVRTVRPLQVTQLFDQVRWSAHDIGRQGFDVSTGFGLVDVAAALHDPAPAIDPQEPNDDIDHVKAHGIFQQAAPPIFRPADRVRRLTARLDATEDPDDVYNVLVGSRRNLRVTVSANADVRLELWNSSARTVRSGNKGLIARSDRRGNTETLFVRKTLRRTQRAYIHVEISSRAVQGTATYRITVSSPGR